MRNNQKGLSLIGFLLLLVVALFVVYIGMKLVPIYYNQFSLVSTMESLAKEPGAANYSERKIRNLLGRKFDTGYVDQVEPRDIEIIRSDVVQIRAKYEVREPLIGNIDAVVKFDHTETLSG